MATETFAKPGMKIRWYPRWTWKALIALAALVALAAVAVEVVWPLSAGLPIGRGQYNNAQFHLHVGTPPAWAAVADSAGADPKCKLFVLLGPAYHAPHTSFDIEKMPRSMELSVAAPCSGSSGGPSALTNGWQPSGQTEIIAGQRANVYVQRLSGDPAVSYAVGVTVHGYSYGFLLTEPSEAQARQDLPTFLTFVSSFRYVS